MTTLLCTKATGLFDGDLVYDVRDAWGRRIQFFADATWSRPFGLEVRVLEREVGGARVLVSLPNGGSVAVHASQLVQEGRR